MPSTTQDLFYRITDYAKAREVETVARDVGVVDHHIHSRWRVYPQDVTSVPTLTAAAAANTFGPWVQVLPINTVPFDIDLIGLVIEQVSAATTYHVQLGWSPTAAAPSTNMESGERRVRMTTVPIARATEVLEIAAQKVPANSSIWGRLKTASGIADTADISIVIARHGEVSVEVPVWPAFPW